MNTRRLNKILRAEASEVEGEKGAWQIEFQDRLLLVLTDESANRVRIFTPVVAEKSVDDEQLRLMLLANFHTALDAKYSLYEGYVISVYTHPLRELQEQQVRDALRQVVQLANTFGTSYSSTDYSFGGQVQEKPVEKTPKKRTTTKT